MYQFFINNNALQNSNSEGPTSDHTDSLKHTLNNSYNDNYIFSHKIAKIVRCMVLGTMGTGTKQMKTRRIVKVC